MRRLLKGVNTTKKKLADGSTKTYHYAWKGGPRLPGKKGSPEFISALAKAHSEVQVTDQKTLQHLFNLYQNSPKFLNLAQRTREDYVKQIRKIESKFGSFPIHLLSDRKARAVFLVWRDELARVSPRQADYSYSVLALILQWSFNQGLAPFNPCERPGKTYRSNRIENVWSASDEEQFLESAPEHMKMAFMIALWTGQRQGDLLRLTWNSYDGTSIRLKQSKTGARVDIPVSTELKNLLDATPRRAVTILSTTRNTSWTESGFRSTWRKAVKAAGVTGVTFHDIRGTSVTRMASAGCTIAEIASVTGHSLRDVGAILDAHYLNRNSELSFSAIQKLEKYKARTESSN